MKKLLLTSAVLLMLSGLATAEKETVYISPNNDGTKDFLEVPIQIKEKRYVKEWSFIIETPDGKVIRTIGNKDKRESRITFKSFWKALFTPKTQIDVPKSVSWNGVMDNGEIAPDGTYKYYMKASDDNGNTAMTAKLDVIVDNTAPEINLAQPSQDEKIFGEGAKITFPINQNGSTEDLWTGVFADALGNPVKTVKWTTAAPLSFDWNGTNDEGLPLPDGVYSYKISAEDRAGNKSAPATITNIIYSAEKPVTTIALPNGKYFSPKGNSTINQITFDVQIPLPNENSGNKLTSWSVKISDDKGTVYRTFFGSDNPPSTISWNGKDDNGNDVKESNTLVATVEAKYLNGYKTAPSVSPIFTLDNTEPKVKVAANRSVFGSGEFDTIEINQTFDNDEIGSPIDNWTGKFVNAKGVAVKEVVFGSYPPAKFIWDGRGNSNEIVDDGTYKYVISASDKAGNSKEITIADITLDTSSTELRVSLNKNAFNPKRPADIKISPIVKSTSKITDFELSILSEEGKEVWKQSGTFMPSSFVWNGSDSSNNICPDGLYVAQFMTKSANGSEAVAKSQPFAIDTVPPSIKLSLDSSIFSPDGDGKKDSLPVKAESSAEENWIARVYNSKNESVKTYTWKGAVDSFDFDGTDSNGNTLPDGTYSIIFTSEDAAGNKASETVPNIIVDNRETKAYITASEYAFSPNGDGKFDIQKFTLKTSLNDGIDSWKIAITSPEGNVVKTWSNENTASIPSTISWDGKGDDGKVVPDSYYTAKLNINYAKGNVIDTASSEFISCATAPEASVKTAPEYFSPDNDGEDDDLFIQLKAKTILELKDWSFQINDPTGKKFWSTSGKSSISEKLIWDGRSNAGELVQSAMDYSYVFTVTDSLGMTSKVEGIIPIDILVVRDGDNLKMAVPSIIFRSDAADFKGEGEAGVAKGKGLTKAQISNNERVLKRIAVVLNKFKNYKVTIEGHANSMTGTEAEETTNQYGLALKPLSKARADFVKAQLVKYGVDKGRLDTIGMGGTKPVVSIKDKENVWKNRRVEFILKK